LILTGNLLFLRWLKRNILAKFRTNHYKGGNSSVQIIRVGLLAAITVGLFFLFQFFTGIDRDAVKKRSSLQTQWNGAEEFALPTTKEGTLVYHQYYVLSYSEEHEQAEWVAYLLSRKRLEQPWVDRYDEFMEDSLVKSGSAHWRDYRNSGYDRGHLAPAADMAFNKEAMRESFYMSNISPQARHFNGGIWRELEELTRNWAKENEELYVVSGPVLSEPGKGRIGDCKVTIPTAFFKVLLDLREPELKGIAFWLPNEVSYQPLQEYALSIDEVEARTGIDFFPELMTGELETKLERDYEIELWRFSKKKYETRIKHWNKR